MILQRVVVRNLKGIEAAEFSPLSERLNLFCGPNESGKSTLVEALHLGLFERSGGQGESKKELQSWGGSEAPEIEIDFLDDEGESWRVTKRFLHRAGTTLAGRNVVLRDTDDAEKRLRELVGTREPGPRGYKETDLGIWPLLWVKQGLSSVPVKDERILTTDARDALGASLAGQTGEVAAGPTGKRVRELVAQERARFWTDTGRENKELRTLQEAALAARTAAEDAHERYLAAQDLADGLARARTAIASLDRRIATQREVVARAEARAEQARTARAALEAQEREVKLALQAREQADAARAERARLEAERTEARRLTDTRAHTEADTAARRTEAETARTAARTRKGEAEAGVGPARRTLEQARRRADQVHRRRTATELAERLDRAAEAEAGLVALQRRLDQLRLDPAQLERLEGLLLARARAADRVDAASARVRITALTALVVDGSPLAAGEAHEVVVADETALVLQELARVEVRPGAGSLEELRAAHLAATEDLAAACRRLGVDDVPAARARVAEVRDLRQEQEGLRARVAVLAPEGLEVLRTQLAEAQAEVLDEEAPDEAPSLVDAQAALDAAEAAAATARSEAEQAAARYEVAHDAWRDAHDQQRSAREQVERLDERLATLPALDALTTQAEQAREVHATAVVRRDHAAATYAEAGGDHTERGLVDDRAALAALEREQKTTRDEVVRLETQLAERNERGLYDVQADAAEAALEAEEAAEAARHEAEVRRTLHEAVERAYRDMVERFAAPVREALSETVGILFPGSSLWLDDEGDVIGLRTGTVEERFEALSGGAREQLGVLVRLGLARVLAAERRLPVVLDDALVASDAERRSRMVEVLRRAADHLQVLVFTCHDADFDRLGDPTRFEVRGRPARTRRTPRHTDA
ncbi:MAG: AAA family ATPase [Alphaproteobacteria bacterium]|nr:AAA family ATPase [Alphaproteobacteria bacterium]